MQKTPNILYRELSIQLYFNGFSLLNSFFVDGCHLVKVKNWMTDFIRVFKKSQIHFGLPRLGNKLCVKYNYLPYCTTKYIFVLGKNKFDIQCHPTISWMY